MALQKVSPGDPITASYMNSLVDTLESLQSRLAVLESGETTPVLIDWSPAGDIEVLSRLILNGRNFIMPSELNTVTMDDAFPIRNFLEGDSNHLVIQVPNVFANLPRLVPVVVTNRNGTSARLQIRILPAVPQQGGQVVIFSTTSSLGQINEGAQYTLRWLVDSQTILPVTYNLRVAFANVQGASPNAWSSGTILSPSGPQTIARGRPLAVSATVLVPAGAQVVDVALRADSVDGLFGRTSDAMSLTVGQTPQTSDPRVLLSVGNIPVLGIDDQPNVVRRVTIDNQDGIELPFGASGLVPVNVHVSSDQSAAGRYDFTAEVEQADGLWQTPVTVTPAQTAQAAPSDRGVQVTLQNTDGSHLTSVKFVRINASHFPSSGSSADFVSFLRFPIRGY